MMARDIFGGQPWDSQRALRASGKAGWWLVFQCGKPTDGVQPQRERPSIATLQGNSVPRCLEWGRVLLGLSLLGAVRRRYVGRKYVTSRDICKLWLRQGRRSSMTKMGIQDSRFRSIQLVSNLLHIHQAISSSGGFR